MKKIFVITAILLIANLLTYAQDGKALKVLISVDMEGITGVVNWEDVDREGKDYDLFRKIMTEETNAAIEGALDAGATEIIVRDAHSTARNILPDLLNPKARLIRDWSGEFKSMVEGIDKSFSAVIFIGYHAKAGTEDAVLEHTMSSKNITDISINGISLPEAGINALIVGYYDVPLVFLAGDSSICAQAKQLFGEIEIVAVKSGIGNAAINLHPAVSHEKIKEGVKKALLNINKYKPYKFKPPYKLVVTLKHEEVLEQRSEYPGVKRTGDWELTYENDDLIEVMKAMRHMF
ncbi:MAG: hypothetical protein A2Y62_04305 [Candidatus Fischerbacteria bacterium RBG_13_37_8]|uniref:Amino acid amidase n=1 Tax=Candidatus Fischerbacteria bacterium RBG_13_37_8 TaxID=1817863 RepID=A0A1F5VFR9_9BACT|nr:MAG: hypothetical protein A2Y62_04305 [Candidatus Fischerbacteria bacterium RBG_13_37_8]